MNFLGPCHSTGGWSPASVGFVVDKMVLGQVLLNYIGFPAKISTDCSAFIIVHLPGLLQQAIIGLSNGGLGSTPP
jgi:hypothetical protein